jgi:hypothetical protein
MAGRRCLQRIVLLNLFFIQQVNAINFSKTIVVISLKTKSLVISKGGKTTICQKRNLVSLKKLKSAKKVNILFVLSRYCKKYCCRIAAID